MWAWGQIIEQPCMWQTVEATLWRQYSQALCCALRRCCPTVETCSESPSARVLRLLGRKSSEFFQEGFQSFDIIPSNLKYVTIRAKGGRSPPFSVSHRKLAGIVGIPRVDENIFHNPRLGGNRIFQSYSLNAIFLVFFLRSIQVYNWASESFLNQDWKEAFSFLSSTLHIYVSHKGCRLSTNVSPL